MVYKRIISIKNNRCRSYYSGEGDGYYKSGNQYQVMGSYRAWSGELGTKAFAPSGLSVYNFSKNKADAYALCFCSIPEIISGILERQKYGFLPKGNIEILEVCDA